MGTTKDPKGRWETIGELPESGQAWLFTVRDRTDEFTGTHVRKVLKNVGRLPRFQREVEITNVLQSNGARVVRVVDAYLEPAAGEKPYYVSRYYTNGNFRAALGSYAGDFESVLAITEELYRLLIDVHQHTAHRDLKPENILLDDEGKLVLCDFGICVPLREEGDAHLSQTLEQQGSRHYIAPEALGGYKAVTNPIALDVYSFGKIIYELATGRPLPGILLPVGDNAISVSLGTAPEWSIINSMLSGLVSHDPAARLSAWERLPKMLNIARRTRVGTGDAGDPDWAATQVRARFEQSEALRLLKITQIREAFRDQLYGAILIGFKENSSVQSILKVSEELRAFAVAYDRDLPPSWPHDVGVTPALAVGAQWARSSIPQLAGTEHHDTSITVIRVAVDVRWDNEDSLSLIFVLARAKWENPIGWSLLPPTPVVGPVLKGRVGDDSFVEEAKLEARQMATQWVQWFLEWSGK